MGNRAYPGAPVNCVKKLLLTCLHFIVIGMQSSLTGLLFYSGNIKIYFVF